MLTDDATYCHVCNTKQSEGFEAFETMVKPKDTFLKVLCILTIIVMGFNLLGLPFSIVALSGIGLEYSVWLIVLGALFSATKLTGAILMLKKKLIGLYIYTVVAILSIGLYLYTNLTINIPNLTSNLPEGPSLIISYVSMGVKIMFSITFIILYWLPVNRRLLS